MISQGNSTKRPMTDTLDRENSADKDGSIIWILIKKGILFDLF